MPISSGHLRFGYAVRTLRQERRMSQERLALESGIDRSYVGAVERGERNLGLANVFKLANALEVPASELHRRAEAAPLPPASVSPEGP
jgi:transcriptional regulator with XRE-family HTH domain